MANDTVYCTFDELMALIEPDFRPICRKLRAIITQQHPEFVEIIWEKQRIASYGIGPKKMSEHYVYIAPHKNHVNLGFYHGAALSDPDGLLEGTGKMLRHVKIRDEESAEDPHIGALIAEAIAEIQPTSSAD